VIHLSKSAIAEIKRLRSRQPDSSGNICFRLRVEAGGCSGLIYKLSFDSASHPNDHLYECDGLQAIVDSQSLQQVKGLQIDYSEDLMGGGFRFQNPNATANCGCGNSFAISQG
jgi:iron-sulfur cluster assembly accessory protein